MKNSSARKKIGRKNSLKTIGVLHSGGLDSNALIGHFLKRGFTVHPIYIKCGLRWEKAELAWVKRFLKSIKNRNLRPLTAVPLLLEGAYSKNWSQRGITPGTHSPDKSVFLPARNLLLIIKSLLALYTKNTTTLAMATLKGNPFADARPTYFRSLENILGRSFDRPIKILTPFRRYHKKEIIKKYRNWPLHLSLSCINPKGIFHCGKCNKCAERKRAYIAAKTKDETFYQARG